MNSLKADFKKTTTQSEATCHKLKNVWIFKLPMQIKIIATVESVLMYGSETWAWKKEIMKWVKWMLCRDSMSGSYEGML